HSVAALRNLGSGQRVRERLTEALQASHQRGEIHVTARELRASLSYIFFGIHDCEEMHEDPDLRPARYWQRAFDARSPQRQGELLAELARFDPALEAHPALDRLLLKQTPPDTAHPGLAEERRRAWFEHPSVEGALPIYLANGRHLPQFRHVPLLDDEARKNLLLHLSVGIAHLEDLPPSAFRHEYIERGVPLRITPRTPTESAFWVVKPWSRFHIEAPLPHSAQGLEALHTHLRLLYRYANGN